MERLHADIHKLKDQTQEKILEVEKHYSDACLDIFEDDSRDKLMTVEVVVEYFQNTFEEASNDENIRQAFRTEEALLDLDVKLGDFVKTSIEVGNYRQKFKDNYEALYLMELTSE